MLIYTIIMESFRDDNLGFYVIIYKSKSSSKAAEIWIRGKDICISLGYKYYKKILQKNVSKENKK